jgi:hypothetical protein
MSHEFQGKTIAWLFAPEVSVQFAATCFPSAFGAIIGAISREWNNSQPIQASLDDPSSGAFSFWKGSFGHASRP